VAFAAHSRAFIVAIISAPPAWKARAERRPAMALGMARQAAAKQSAQPHALCCLCTLQVERLQHKFSLIHSTLAQQATLQAAPAGVKQSDLTERLSLMSLSDSVRYGWTRYSA
jgi:hypothetical protein